MTLFEIKNLTKIYGGRTVLDIPELFFEKGIIYSLQGPNGSGKTTLLEILSLLIKPTTGVIKYNQTTIPKTENHLTELRREIVMVQQNPVLFSTTVYKNLEFGLKVRKISSNKREKTIEKCLDLLGMRDFMHAQANKLSGGETQRIAIARALVCSPKVIFFDEPTANVDMENQVAIERVLSEINAQKDISVIFTTHNPTQASRLSHEVISLFEGRKVPSIFENIYSGRIINEIKGEKICIIQDRVRLHLNTEKSDKIRLAIDPSKIEIIPQKENNPGKNLFTGKLIQITDENDSIRAVVDIGVPVNILLSKKAPGTKKFFIGDQINLYCPPKAIRVFP